jgi:hypothetical protein
MRRFVAVYAPAHVHRRFFRYNVGGSDIAMACITLQARCGMPAMAEEDEVGKHVDLAGRNKLRVLMTLSANRSRGEAGALFCPRTRMAVHARQLHRSVPFMAECKIGAAGGA